MMATTEKAPSRVSFAPPSSLELDPLLRDLTEKKQSFRRNVASLANELKDARSRLALQESSFVRETQTRQIAESRASFMEEEICRLQQSLEERNGQLLVSNSSAQQFVKELDKVKLQLSVTQAAADASAASAQSTQDQCLCLLRELNEKNSSLKEQESRVNILGEQLDLLQKDLQARELSQKQLRDEVARIEKEIMHAVAKAGAAKDCELRKILEEVSPRNVENINKHLNAKDEEVARLRDEIRFLSAHWKHKTKELESQLEKHRRADQELKKRVLKLEFCLQEARLQTRKLQRMGERRDRALKELREQLAMKQQNAGGCNDKEHIFWESPGFKIVASMSILVLVGLAKR